MKILKIDDLAYPTKGYVIDQALTWLREGYIVWLERSEIKHCRWRVCKGVEDDSSE